MRGAHARQPFERRERVDNARAALCLAARGGAGRRARRRGRARRAGRPPPSRGREPAGGLLPRWAKLARRAAGSPRRRGRLSGAAAPARGSPPRWGELAGWQASHSSLAAAAAPPGALRAGARARPARGPARSRAPPAAPRAGRARAPARRAPGACRCRRERRAGSLASLRALPARRRAPSGPRAPAPRRREQRAWLAWPSAAAGRRLARGPCLAGGQARRARPRRSPSPPRAARQSAARTGLSTRSLLLKRLPGVGAPHLRLSLSQVASYQLRDFSPPLEWSQKVSFSGEDGTMGHSCYLQQCPSCYPHYYQICTQNNFKISQHVASLRHQRTWNLSSHA